MLQVCKNISTIVLDSNHTKKNLEYLNKYIDTNNCTNMTVDISTLNILDATKVATLGSTIHYMKYPEGSINWIVNSKKVKEYTTPMNLGNCQFICKK